ncbi:nucleotidyltransferase [Cohnella sp. GCM10027633]|uniref:nucleotidyltransferase domain-containing protein n=1 Tax=unclassified Cohnella TaxID=2636738 RepID=UPI003635CB15
MARDWNQTFNSWTKPASDTEEDKCANAETMIKDAIKADLELSKMNIEIIPQGSYRNNTNVRANSDVDICVKLKDTFFYDLPQNPPKSANDFNIVPSSYTYSEFKNAVEVALVNKFGRTSVARGNKAFDIKANTYRVEADVVPCFEHRRYFYTANGGYDYLSGIELRPDTGSRIINWPKQHYENGVSKNKETGNKFKFTTRVFKRLRNEMKEQGVQSAEYVPSFLIECLIWNVPNNIFSSNNYFDLVREAIIHLYNSTKSEEGCSEWGEVNELKYLFRQSQPWTRQQANQFLIDAWNYVGYK